MTRGDALIRLTARLIARRDALRKVLAEDVSRLREPSEVVGHGDQVDAAVDSANDEICSRLAEIESRELAEIEQTLRRIAERRYGRCTACGGRIPASRLNALPCTTRCIDCQRRDERRNRSEAQSPDAGGWERVDVEPEQGGNGVPMAWVGRGMRGFRLEDLADTCLAQAARMM
jgi:DnaK suppressor protein